MQLFNNKLDIKQRYCYINNVNKYLNIDDNHGFIDNNNSSDGEDCGKNYQE